MLKKAKVGVRLRRFREERQLTQAALAGALGISPSYINQMESNQRPITVPVLLKLAEVFDVDVRQFSSDEADRLVAQLRDLLAEAPAGESISLAETRELATTLPAVAQHLIALHQQHRHAVELNQSIAAHLDRDGSGLPAGAPLTAYEEVRDFFYTQRNHFAALDEAAEQLFESARLKVANCTVGLITRLRDRHDIDVIELSAGDVDVWKRSYDPGARQLALSGVLTSGQRAFQLATHLALIEQADVIDQILADAPPWSDETTDLARIGLANYFAGALILPYRQFLNAAEELRYDIELLQRRFGVGYETVTHRLSTLQRPGHRGVPFFLVRVDRAGNISKRQSATDFHFSRVGGTCPLWNVYEAFAYPGQIRTQLAEMPDGRSYLWVARTVSRRYGGYGTPDQTFAIGLGCDLHHANRLVYADALDLAHTAARTPIGPGCKVCDRTGCPQRAFPPAGRPLQVRDDRSTFVPYVMADTTRQDEQLAPRQRPLQRPHA